MTKRCHCSCCGGYAMVWSICPECGDEFCVECGRSGKDKCPACGSHRRPEHAEGDTRLCNDR
jgi:hypothetical protein